MAYRATDALFLFSTVNKSRPGKSEDFQTGLYCICIRHSCLWVQREIRLSLWCRDNWCLNRFDVLSG